MSRRLLPLIVIILGLGLILFASSVEAASPTPLTTPTPPATITPTFDPARLEPPPTANPPGQVDEGAQYYWGVCMSCHGDRGQGLTDAWRDSFGPEDRDCWQSGCHGPDHPPESFLIPLDSLAPPVAGTGKLTGFSNAFELYEYILENMPWWYPGSTTSDTALATTNYLLKLHGTRPKDLILTVTNANAIPVHRAVQLPEPSWPGALLLGGTLAFAALGLGASARRDSNLLNKKPNWVHHLHPPSIPAAQARYRYTLGVGGLAIFLSLVLLFTGLLEMYYYIPVPEAAARSVETLTTLVPYGSLVRNLHYWSAQILLVVMTLHLLRVVLTGAYARPRRFNFLLGIFLLITILLLDFTGYVLRWDEGIRWALVVGTNLLKTVPGIGEGLYRFVMGGPGVGPATRIRFYAWHLFGLPLLGAVLIGWHAFRVRRDGGIAVPPPTERDDNERITRFELLRREVLAMVLAGIVLLLLATIIPAPIDQPITGSSVDTADSRAPWFFLWVQQLLKYGDPFLWGVLTPLLVAAVLALIPYILPGPRSDELGSWFPRGNRIAQSLVILIVSAILILTFLGALQP